jgi:phytoene dehydrogenase-like protein
LESHDRPGGAAHSFEIKGYKFDSGPSLFSGFQSRGPQANPLAQVFLLSIFLCCYLRFPVAGKLIMLLLHDKYCCQIPSTVFT